MNANQLFSELIAEEFALPAGPTRQRSPEERLVLAVLCDAVDSLSHASKQVRLDAAKWIEDRTEAPWSFAWACSIFGFDADAFRWKLRDRIEAAREDDVPAYTRRTIVNNVGQFNRGRPHRILRDFHGNSAQSSRKNMSVRRERDRSKQVAPDRLARIVAAIPVEPARAHVRKVYSLLPDLSQSSIRVAIKVATERGSLRRVAYGVYSRRSARWRRGNASTSGGTSRAACVSSAGRRSRARTSAKRTTRRTRSGSATTTAGATGCRPATSR